MSTSTFSIGILEIAIITDVKFMCSIPKIQSTYIHRREQVITFIKKKSYFLSIFKYLLFIFYRTPTLFVIGDSATQTRPDDLEDVRERMRAETSMVVIGGADDQLRMSKHKKTAEGITQNMVDRCIADEIHTFISYVLNAPPPTAFAIPSVIPSTPVCSSNHLFIYFIFLNMYIVSIFR